ncbi:hypothetical protein DY000_02054285 [Brassica cretica]|uniref:EXS domain-containing protein n=1 Tax=Brassica cretica TaxID=69181 RepID=A0ABQ7AGG1_BRACR|nr:hypothetical protein DY000_02054285 [Brassica cretica]
MVRAESTVIEHFCNSNRRQGMNLLRPKENKELHRTTFSTGFFFGCATSLIIALALIIHVRNIMGTPGQRTYMETMFPLYRFFGFVVLHVVMYAANIYFWGIYRVNYSFIFGFKQGTELGYRHVLLLSFGLGTLSLCAVLLNLDMEMDSQTKDYRIVTELIPLFLLAVNLPDFFLADQLTSQVQALRSLEFYICYYGFGDFRQRQRNTCRSNDVFTTFYFIVAVIPYRLRFLQCIKRIIEENDLSHGYNAAKYLLTIVAACLRTAYTLNRGTTWNITAWVFSGVATLYATYWDIVIDWGLLQRGCKNCFLRDKLLVPHKTVYYAAMVLNVLLRLVWLQTVLDLKFSFLHRETLVLKQVNLPDFFLADQLTSQVQALRSLEFYICYYGFGDFRQRQRNTCRSNDVFTTFYFIVAVIPYRLRFLQCIKRIIEENDLSHGYNAAKYLLTIVAACLRTAYTLNRGTTWNITAWVFSGVATLYATYWDIVIDWGLLQRGCKNCFLRDKLLVPHKTVYYAAMVLNVLLRLVWLQTVLDLKFSFLHRETLVALLACLEIIRRGIWNFFRLENEHLNNVGKFRAFKSVPLPFNYQEDRDQDN